MLRTDRRISEGAYASLFEVPKRKLCILCRIKWGHLVSNLCITATVATVASAKGPELKKLDGKQSSLHAFAANCCWSYAFFQNTSKKQIYTEEHQPRLLAVKSKGSGCTGAVQRPFLKRASPRIYLATENLCQRFFNRAIQLQANKTCRSVPIASCPVREMHGGATPACPEHQAERLCKKPTEKIKSFHFETNRLQIAFPLKHLPRIRLHWEVARTDMAQIVWVLLQEMNGFETWYLLLGLSKVFWCCAPTVSKTSILERSHNGLVLRLADLKTLTSIAHQWHQLSFFYI